MKIAIIGNGRADPFEKVIKEYNFIVAADGGANHCYNKKIKPHIILGDLDSIKPEVKKHFHDVPQIKKTSQDATDIEKILQFLEKNIIKQEKPKLIDLFCVTSTERPDHMLANIYFMKQKAHWPLRIQSEDFTLEIIDKNKTIKNQKNKIVSLFPLAPTKNLKLAGFKWSLNDEDVKNGKISISNIINNEKAEIQLDAGQILLIINK